MKLVTDQMITDKDAVILLYVQPSNKTSQQYADNLIVKSFDVTDKYDESLFDDEFLQSLDSSIGQGQQNFWATHSKEYILEITIQTKSL